MGLPWGLSTRSIWPDYHECQCSILVFDGLLLKLHNSVTLLFMCCSWNRLAKLWIHTGWTLDIFDGVTNMIGAELHHSATITCKAFPTKELWHEMNACQHQALKKNGDGNALLTVCSGQYLGSLPKKFNINTIKNYMLGDYPNQIHHFGITDSHSTEPVSSLFFTAMYTQISVLLSGQTRTPKTQVPIQAYL